MCSKYIIVKYTYVNQNHHYCVRCTNRDKTVYKNQTENVLV